MCNPAGAPCGHQPALLGTGQLSPCHHWRLHSKIIHCAVYVLRATAATLMCRTPNCSKACEPSAPTTYQPQAQWVGHQQPGSSRHNNGLVCYGCPDTVFAAALLCCRAAPPAQTPLPLRYGCCFPSAVFAATAEPLLPLLLLRCCLYCSTRTA